MLTVLIQPALPWDIVSLWAVLFSPGLLIIRKQSLIPLVKQNMSPSVRLAVKPFGCANSFVKFSFWSPILLSFFATTMVPSRFHPILPTIRTANTLTSAITLCMSALKTALSLCGMFPVTTMSQTYLQRCYLIPTSRVFVPTLASGDACARRSLWLASISIFLFLSRFPLTMPAGSFFPKGFDAPSTRILPILFFLFHSYLTLCFYFLSPFFPVSSVPSSWSTLWGGVLSSWALQRDRSIIHYIIPTISTLTGAHYFPQLFFHWLRWVLWPAVFVSLVLTSISLIGYYRYSTNDIVVLPPAEDTIV